MYSWQFQQEMLLQHNDDYIYLYVLFSWLYYSIVSTNTFSIFIDPLFYSEMIYDFEM